MNSNYSAQEKNFATALLHNLWKYLLLAASIVATVKIIFCLLYTSPSPRDCS